MEQITVAIYGRVSDADSERESSIGDQIRDGRAFAQKQWPNCTIIEFKEIGSAATISKRPVFRKVLAAAQAGKIDAIVVRDQDRLSRDVADMLQLELIAKTSSVGIWLYRTRSQYKADTPIEEFFNLMSSGLSALERKQTAVRTRDRIQSMRKEGKWTGGYTPRGYSLEVKDGEKNYVPNADAPKIVRAFEVAAQTRSLARAHEACGLFSLKTGTQNALRNKVYAGCYRLPDGSWMPNHHEPIVSEKLFMAAQKITALPFNIKARVTTRVWTLQSLMRCEHCGKIMTTYHTAKPNGLKFYYYECGRTKASCPTKRLHAADTEDYFWTKVQSLCANPKILLRALEAEERAFANQNPAIMAELDEAKRDCARCRNRTNSVMATLDGAYFGKGLVAPQALLTKLEQCESQQNIAKARVAELEQKAVPVEKLKADEFIAAFQQVFNDGNSSAEKKQAVLRALVQEIVVGPANVRVVLRDPASAMLPVAVGDRLRQRTGQLPELDSNQ